MTPRLEDTWAVIMKEEDLTDPTGIPAAIGETETGTTVQGLVTIVIMTGGMTAVMTGATIAITIVDMTVEDTTVDTIAAMIVVMAVDTVEDMTVADMVVLALPQGGEPSTVVLRKTG